MSVGTVTPLHIYQVDRWYWVALFPSKHLEQTTGSENYSGTSDKGPSEKACILIQCEALTRDMQLVIDKGGVGDLQNGGLR